MKALFSAAIAAMLLFSATQKATADIIDVTYTGTVGANGQNPGLVFGPAPIFASIFTLTYTFDTGKGDYSDLGNTSFSIGGSLYIPNTESAGFAVLSINGRSFTVTGDSGGSIDQGVLGKSSQSVVDVELSPFSYTHYLVISVSDPRIPEAITAPLSLTFANHAQDEAGFFILTEGASGTLNPHFPDEALNSGVLMAIQI
jgi:hypothetical protein